MQKEAYTCTSRSQLIDKTRQSRTNRQPNARVDMCDFYMVC